MPLIDDHLAQAMGTALEVLQTELLQLREHLLEHEQPPDLRERVLNWVQDVYLRVDLILSTTQGKN